MNRNNLHQYQNEAIEHILTHPFCALFLEMGLGKTVSTLTAINELSYTELDIKSVLVIAPKRVAESVWDSEVSKWEHLKHLRVSKIIGTPKERAAALAKDADIYVMGRDNVAWLYDNYFDLKRPLPFDMLVIDELTSFKNHASVRFKKLRIMQPMFKRVVGLTGTPSPNGLIDLWAQIYLLDRGARLGKYISHFRDEFFRPGARNGMVIYTYVPQADGEERIYKRIGDICMSMKAKDYLTLPERITNIVTIELTDKLKKEYEEFEKEQVLSLVEEGIDIPALGAAALSNKLLQFANGAVYDPEGGVHPVHSLKIDATKEIIEAANGKPVLIGWTYRHDRDRLMEELKEYKPRELKTNKDIEDWNAGKIQVMMMHPASGGHGLNLQAGGHIIIWFGQTWNLELEQQFNARLDRQGQTESVIIHKLVVKGTVDEDVIKAQQRKNNTQEELMAAVKARIKKYTMGV